MTKPTADELALLHERLCHALGDQTRLALLFELADGPMNVSRLVESLGVPQARISRHLGILRDRGLVASQRDGNRVSYRLKDRRVIEAINLMRAVLTDQLRSQPAWLTAVLPRDEGPTSSGPM